MDTLQTPARNDYIGSQFYTICVVTAQKVKYIKVKTRLTLNDLMRKPLTWDKVQTSLLCFRNLVESSKFGVGKFNCMTEKLVRLP